MGLPFFVPACVCTRANILALGECQEKSYESRKIISLDFFKICPQRSPMPKFTVMFKMPSAGSDAVRQAVDDKILVKPSDIKKAEKLVQKFFEYDEYAYIEIDTETGLARVRPVVETSE